MMATSVTSSRRRSTREPAGRGRRPGFTLVELLVVIVIIGVLAALLVPALIRAVGTAGQTALKLEVDTAAGKSIESYANEVAGGTYPPGMNTGGLGGAAADRVYRNFKRHFKRAFPRHREPESLLLSLCGRPTGSPTAEAVEGGLSPAEALVFFLQRFSKDPRYPISGPGGPTFPADEIEDLAARNWIPDFNEDRYGPRTEDNLFAGRALLYTAPLDVNGDGLVNAADQLRLNLWQYFPGGSEEPLAYFDASRGILDAEHPRLRGVFALKQLKPGADTSNGVQFGDLQLCNAGKFQVLHCGSDGAWGDFSVVRAPLGFAADDDALQADTGNPLVLFPGGPFTLDLADTVTNFNSRPALEDAEE